MGEPLAYFLTFGTYGAWLHGDPRGSKDRHYNVVGQPPRDRSDRLQNWERQAATHPPFRITPAVRAVIERSLRNVCSDRSWALLEMNVRTEHVHVVISGRTEPERMMTSLKAGATRELRNLGLVAPDAKLWARHGSTRYLWTDADVLAARDYVLNSQGAALPGSSWRERRDLGAD